MKFASLKNHTRDGKVVFVSRDLKRYIAIEGFETLQEILENWDDCRSRLEAHYEDFDQKKEGQVFDAKCCAAPLPRAYQWLDGSSYVNHVELVRKSRGVEMPASFWEDPLMYQGASDNMLGPCDDIVLANEDWGIDCEAEIAVVCDDVAMGVTPDEAGSHIKLLMLVNDVSLRALAMQELTKSFGFVQSKPATAFSPIAITPDELGKSWDDYKIHLPLSTHVKGELLGNPDAGTDMVFNFARLVSHAAKSRFLSAGTIIGSGTISNKDRSKGSSCIVEKRTIETIESGQARSEFLKFGDRIHIEMHNEKGESVFGAIDQVVKPYIK